MQKWSPEDKQLFQIRRHLDDANMMFKANSPRAKTMLEEFQEKGSDKLKLKPLKSLKSLLKMLTIEVKTLINKWIVYHYGILTFWTCRKKRYSNT